MQGVHSVSPYVQCIVLAQANCIGNYFGIMICDLLRGIASGFAIQEIGVQFGKIFVSYSLGNLIL
jgi:hypothetical protein